MAQIAAEWDARLVAIKRIAESVARRQPVNIDERSTC
jgi:hypothetical protein